VDGLGMHSEPPVPLPGLGCLQVRTTDAVDGATSEGFCDVYVGPRSKGTFPTRTSMRRFDWNAEVVRAKALIASGEVDFDLEDVRGSIARMSGDDDG